MLVPAAALGLLLLTTSPHLEKARALLGAMRFEEAEEELRFAQGTPDDSGAEGREITDLLARCFAARGRFDLVTEAYSVLLAKDPKAPQPLHAAPRIRASFQTAKTRLYPPGFVSVSVLLAQPRTLILEAVDPWSLVVGLQLVESPTPSGPSSTRFLQLKDSALRVELAQTTGSFLLQARAADGRVLFEKAGAVKAPTSFPRVDTPHLAHFLPETAPLVKGASVTRRRGWTPWAMTALSVLALGVGTGLAIASKDASTAAGTTRFASDTLALDRRAQRTAIAADAVLGGAALAGGASVGLWLW